MTQNTALFTPVSAWSDIPTIQREIERWTAAQRDAFLQMLLNRAEWLKDLAGGGSNVMLTPEGGLAVKCLNRTGAATEEGMVVAPFVGWDVSPGTTTLSNAVSVAGDSLANTSAGKLYLAVTVPGGAATVSAYSDSARTVKVAEGALADNLGGTVSLAAVGGSGLTFDIDIEAGAVAAADATMVRGALCAVQECDAAATNQIGVMYSDGIPAGGDCWIVIAGRCQVQVGAGAEIPWGVPASSAGDPRYDWEEAFDYLVPAGAGEKTHLFSTPVPIPDEEGAYLVEMEIIVSRTDSAAVSPGHGVVLTNPLRFAVFRNAAGVLAGPAGATSITPLWAVAVAGAGSTANATPSAATLEITDDAPYLQVVCTYGTADQNFRWGAHARVTSANV